MALHRRGQDDASGRPPVLSPSPGERFEQSALGRLVISAAVAALLLAEIATHLPASSFERAVIDPANHLLGLAGSEQTWVVFAPNPRSVSLDMEARVTFADGSTARWTLPDGPAFGANLRFYRWRKWLERVRADDESPLWDPTARWIASLYDDRPSPVTRVELIRRFHDDIVDGPQPPWQAFTFSTLELDGTIP